MLKKYLPFIALAAAAFLLWYVKKYQRGTSATKPAVEQAEHITVAPPPENNTTRTADFNRRVSNIIYSKHARCRMECRHIDESEVKEILEKGTVNESRIETGGRGKTYPLEGITHDKQHVRIVFAPKDNGEVVVVTCVDLDKEWDCDCK